MKTFQHKPAVYYVNSSVDGKRVTTRFTERDSALTWAKAVSSPAAVYCDYGHGATLIAGDHIAASGGGK